MIDGRGTRAGVFGDFVNMTVECHQWMIDSSTQPRPVMQVTSVLDVVLPTKLNEFCFLLTYLLVGQQSSAVLQ